MERVHRYALEGEGRRVVGDGMQLVAARDERLHPAPGVDALQVAEDAQPEGSVGMIGHGPPSRSPATAVAGKRRDLAFRAVSR